MPVGDFLFFQLYSTDAFISQKQPCLCNKPALIATNVSNKPNHNHPLSPRQSLNAINHDAEFTALLDKNYPRWYGIARAYAPGDDREDLLQEILLQVWKSLPKFSEKSHVDTWAYRVALNTALAWKRKTSRLRKHVQTETVDISQLATSHNSPQAETKILDEFLQSLTKIDRAVMLVHLDGLADDQATEITGLSDGAFRVRLHRLKKKFQETYCNTEEKP